METTRRLERQLRQQQRRPRSSYRILSHSKRIPRSAGAENVEKNDHKRIPIIALRGIQTRDHSDLLRFRCLQKLHSRKSARAVRINNTTWNCLDVNSDVGGVGDSPTNATGSPRNARAKRILCVVKTEKPIPRCSSNCWCVRVEVRPAWNGVPGEQRADQAQTSCDRASILSMSTSSYSEVISPRS